MSIVIYTVYLYCLLYCLCIYIYQNCKRLLQPVSFVFSPIKVFLQQDITLIASLVVRDEWLKHLLDNCSTGHGAELYWRREELHRRKLKSAETVCNEN